MSLVIPPGFAQVALRFELTGDTDPIYITHGVDISDVADIPAISQRIYKAMVGTGGPIENMSNKYRLTRIHMSVGQDGGPPTIYEQTVAFDGAATSDPLPQNCAVLVRKRTGLGGREGRGRMYVPGLPEAQCNEAGVIGSGYLSTLAGEWIGYLAYLSTAASGSGATAEKPCHMYILHTAPQIGGAPAPTLVTSLAVDSRIATQRGRLRR